MLISRAFYRDKKPFLHIAALLLPLKTGFRGLMEAVFTPESVSDPLRKWTKSS